MDVLAISGSLRAGASNTALLAAAAAVAPSGMRIELYTGMAALPHFNPDLDAPDAIGLPDAVAELRARVARADALLLSTPEYAHGLPGSFKNLLDWLVGSVDFAGKPVAVLGASARARHAPAQLREVLVTMSAHVVDGACRLVPLTGSSADAADVLAQQAATAVLTEALRELAQTVARQRGAADAGTRP